MASKKPPAPAEEVASPTPVDEEAAAEVRSLTPFLDVPIDVTVELARKKLKVREILDLRIDSLIHMEQSAGENVDIRLNGVAVGNGEIVVIEDMMGLRITDLKTRLLDQE